MPVKKGRNKGWWERWDPSQRYYDDARLKKILRSLDPPDAVRLAQLIYEDVEKARRMRKGLPALRQKITGRRSRKTGPKPRTDLAQELRSKYIAIKALVDRECDATEIASFLGLNGDRGTSAKIAHQLDTRRGSASKTLGVLIVAIG
jgi:hypothetical protein